jgi:hypothetical protein
VGRGYAEGPAIEERLDALERNGPEQPERPSRRAVYGSTADRADKHFLGWLGDVDPDELFDSGRAWGLSIVRRAEPAA